MLHLGGNVLNVTSEGILEDTISAKLIFLLYSQLFLWIVNMYPKMHPKHIYLTIPGIVKWIHVIVLMEPGDQSR